MAGSLRVSAACEESSNSEERLIRPGIVKKAEKAKVAVYTCGLDISQTETKGTVLLKKADDLLNFSRGEEKQLEGVCHP